MNLEIKDLLNRDEIVQLRDLAGRMKFIDGRATNTGFKQKQNLQGDPGDAAFEQSAKIVKDAFNRSPEFKSFAFPKRMAPPTLARYEPGMKYGPHADSAYLPLAGGQLRSDLSSTVFLSEPAAYEGGELVLHLGDAPIPIKYAPGLAVLYPSTSLHEVRAVNSGTRLVSLTFIESYVPDEQERTMLYELGEISALEGDNMHWLSRMRLEVVRQNLMRRWSRG